MRFRLLASLILAASLVPALAPAHATSSYHYGQHEYIVIRDGLAPNRKMSIAAHGSGELGDDDFHLWLMAEPAHKRLTVLDDVSYNDAGVARPHLDSGADAYTAVWSPDSRHVAVSFRTNRHMLQLNIYALEGRRAVLVSGPSLFREVAGREIGDKTHDIDDYRMRIYELTWRSPSRFMIAERRLLQTRDAGLAGRLGGYSKELKIRAGDGDRLIGFSAEAECRLLPGSRYKCDEFRPGKLDAFADD